MEYLTLDWLVFILPLTLAFILFGATLVGFDGDFEPDVDVEADGLDKILSALGIGKVPLSVMLYATLASFGMIGLYLKTHHSDKPQLFHVCFALLLSMFVGNVLARLFAAFLPSVETYAPSKRGMVGLYGVTITPVHPVTGGVVSVIDLRGQRHRVTVVPADTIRGVVPVGVEVVLSHYDVAKDVFEIIPKGE